jgi:hypothetical protein
MKMEIDRQVIVRAGLFTLALLVPTYLIRALITAVADLPDNSNFDFIPTIAMLIEMALGGARAARLKPEAPFSHGALAAIAAYAALLLVVIPVQILTGGLEDPVFNLVAYLVFFLSIAGAMGCFGALVATSQRERARTRRRHRPER